MQNSEYNLVSFFKNLRKNGLRRAWNDDVENTIQRGYEPITPFVRNARRKGINDALSEDWKKTKERGIDTLVRTYKAAASGAVVGIPLFGVEYLIIKGMEAASAPNPVALSVVVPYHLLASLITSFAIGDGFSEKRTQILEAPEKYKKGPSMIIYRLDI